MGHWLNLLPPPLEEEGLPLPSDSLSSSPAPSSEETPLRHDHSDDLTSNENHSTDDSDSESETFMNVPESEWLDKNIATAVAHTVYTSNADSVTGLNSAEIDSAEIDDSVDDVNIQGPGGNPTLKGDVDGFVSVASTTVSSAEVDRSSVLSDDSSDVTARDELDDTTCAPRMRRHGSDGSDDDGCIAAKIALGSSDEPPPLSGDASVDPGSGLISVVDYTLDASASGGDTQVMDPSGSALGDSPLAGTPSVDLPSS